MRVHLIRADGTEQFIELDDEPSRPLLAKIGRLIGAQALDSFNLHNGKRVWVDDLGGAKNLPLNRKATAIYHSICIPGTRHEIVGDVAIVPEVQESPE
jgi:hypothetical protein